jgi:hypothetical protein
MLSRDKRPNASSEPSSSNPWSFLDNRDLRRRLYSDEAVAAAEERRRSAAETRKIRLLRAHGVISKVGKARCNRLTDFGQALLTGVFTAQAAQPAKLQLAA